MFKYFQNIFFYIKIKLILIIIFFFHIIENIFEEINQFFILIKLSLMNLLNI